MISVTAPAGLLFAGQAFDLGALRGGQPVPANVFSGPVTVTVQYDGVAMAPFTEDSLRLLFWNGSAWTEEGITVGRGSRRREPAGGAVGPPQPLCAVRGTGFPALPAQHASLVVTPEPASEPSVLRHGLDLLRQLPPPALGQRAGGANLWSSLLYNQPDACRCWPAPASTRLSLHLGPRRSVGQPGPGDAVRLAPGAASAA